jgi:hypothetical protein
VRLPSIAIGRVRSPLPERSRAGVGETAPGPAVHSDPVAPCDIDDSTS